MNYKKFSWPTEQPTGKQNCIVWLHTGEKVTASFNKKLQYFVGLYNEWEGKTLDTQVKEWSYAIVQKRQSRRLEDFLIHLTLKNGDTVAKNSFSRLGPVDQARLFDELELTNGAIMMSYEKG